MPDIKGAADLLHKRKDRSIQRINVLFSAYDVRKHGESACALDLDSKASLMLGAGSGDAAGKNLAPLGGVSAETVGILIIDFRFLGAETAHLLAEKHLAPATAAAVVGIAHGILHRHIIIHISHLFIRHISSP